jgi:hypothetical protein
MKAETRQTKISLDWGSIYHVLFGLLAVLLNMEYLFTVIFLVKQFGDAYFLGEDWADTSGDIVEYVIGLIIGLCLKWVGVLHT